LSANCQEVLKPRDEQWSPCLACALRNDNICGLLFGENEQCIAPNLQLGLAQVSQSHRTALRRQTIYRGGQPSKSIAVICAGWACTYIKLPDGDRQILSFLLPGDMTSATAVFQDSSPVSIEAVSDLRYCTIDKAELRAVLTSDRRVLDAFFEIWARKKDAVEQLASDLGHRTAEQRIARLLLDLTARLGARGLVCDGRFAFPLRLQHIADATGLTIVHVSRVTGTMRKLSLIELDGRFLTILNLGGLKNISNAD